MTDPASFADLLAGSYLRLTGRPLVPDGLHGPEAAAWLGAAPFGLLAHDTSPDPVFVYANRTAQELFGYDTDELVGLPSRLSAGAQDRDERRAFMESVRRDGYADDYRGPRVRKDGGRFWIEDSTVWNLVDGGALVGQAAQIRSWT
ncbi:MEKHLA domain-containing protein [Actinoplanes sp. NPDC049265]|uniref:MEKHLA domain-containing protein n=1 Tax=Actinoplanes sp. NPDC049265 TaxID=3363902 RepID=UPI00371F7B04